MGKHAQSQEMQSQEMSTLAVSGGEGDEERAQNETSALTRKRTAANNK
jgi:hypothetical protein